MRKAYNELLGKYVELPDECRRIVSLSPAITEALFDMGLGDRVCGVSTYCVRPAEARQRKILGSYNTVKLDVLRELKPDLLFVTTGYQRDLIDSLAEFSLFPIALPISVSEIISAAVTAGVAAGYYERARDLERRLLRGLCNIENGPGRWDKRVYIEIDLGGPVTFGAYSYITDAIHLAGGQNIFGSVAQEWMVPDFQSVRELDPDVIIYEPKMFKIAGRDKESIIKMFDERGLGELRAVREGQLFVTPGTNDFFAHHGPGFMIEVLPWLKEILSS